MEPMVAPWAGKAAALDEEAYTSSAIRPGTPLVRTAAAAEVGISSDSGTDSADRSKAHTATAAADSRFCVPRKTIKLPQDVLRFAMSETHHAIMGFVSELQAAARGRPISASCDISDSVQKAISMLAIMEQWIQEIPPLEQGMRYGNKAFKQWHARLLAELPGLLAELLPDSDVQSAIIELSPYLADGFGNATRIDYGTGHETSFVAWMLAMRRLGVFVEADMPALSLRLFPRYLAVMRKLQRTYMLEPAGSHGVWGLDDYHFLPFLIGAAQLEGRERLGCTPAAISDQSVLEEGYEDYLYLEGIRFIGLVKTGPFFEHSPMLHDISTSVSTWRKVASGMLKMYDAEVLQKFPVAQHFLFGSLLPPPR